MKIVQVCLRNPEAKETLMTWLDNRPDLKVGVSVSLKDFKPDIKWQVLNIYKPELDSKDLDFHRKWDNNNYDKHTGLGV